MLTTIEKVLLLQNIDLFAHVTSEQISFLAALAKEVVVEPKRTIYKENETPDGLYVLISGTVVMRRAGEEIERVGANSSFGVWALFDDEPRVTTAETAEESRLLFVSRDDFYEILADHVDIVRGLFKHLVGRIRRLTAVVDYSVPS